MPSAFSHETVAFVQGKESSDAAHLSYAIDKGSYPFLSTLQEPGLAMVRLSPSLLPPCIRLQRLSQSALQATRLRSYRIVHTIASCLHVCARASKTAVTAHWLQTMVAMKPCSVLLPHVHSRANKIMTVLSGTMNAGVSQVRAARVSVMAACDTQCSSAQPCAFAWMQA